MEKIHFSSVCFKLFLFVSVNSMIPDDRQNQSSWLLTAEFFIREESEYWVQLSSGNMALRLFVDLGKLYLKGQLLRRKHRTKLRGRCVYFYARASFNYFY